MGDGTDELGTTPRRRVRPGRMALMRTAVGLMGERGYHGTSTRDIAAAADVSVAALYYHFPSKLDLLRDFLHEAHDVVLARMGREVEAAGSDPRARLDAAVETVIAASLHDDWAQLAAQVAWREHGRLDEPDRRKVVAKREQMVDLVGQVVQQGVEAGVFTVAEPREAGRAVLSLCLFIVEPFTEMNRSMDEVIRLYQRFAAALVGARTAPP